MRQPSDSKLLCIFHPYGIGRASAGSGVLLMLGPVLVICLSMNNNLSTVHRHGMNDNNNLSDRNKMNVIYS